MLAKLSVEEFLQKTGSAEPVPGGGSIAAMSGATGAALTQMVANLTIGRKKYEAVEAEMKEIAEKAARLQSKLIRMIDQDADSFQAVMEAMKLPKNTEEEKGARRAAMEAAFQKAAQVPFEVADQALGLMELIQTVVSKGNQNAVTDGAVAAMMVRTGVLSAIYNAEINLTSIADQAFVSEMKEKLARIRAQVIEKESYILGQIQI